MKTFDLSKELWREYDFCGRVYRIVAPKTLFISESATTHRVLDAAGIVHCVPSPTNPIGCVLRWENADKSNPVNF